MISGCMYFEIVFEIWRTGSAHIKCDRMKRMQVVAAIGLTVLLTSGCSNSPDQSSKIQSLETRVVELEKQVKELAGRPAPAAATTSAPTATATASPNASASPQAGESPAAKGEALWQTLAFDSLPSPEILKEVVSLGFLPKAGITDQKTFEGELTRGQYIALLVEMNNELHEPTDQIRMAREGQAFEDVPPSHPYYKYIQGMVDAGYVIGFDEKKFQPDKKLTREELVAIAAKRDFDFKDFDAEYTWTNYVLFTDKKDVAPKYRAAVAKDQYESGSNLKQAFGVQKLFHPKRNVRAYEAVLTLPGVGGHSIYTYEQKVKQAMGKE